MAIDFYNNNTHPITVFTNGFQYSTKSNNQITKTHKPWVGVKDFIKEDYVKSSIVAKELGIGTKKLSFRMSQLGFERVISLAKTYYLKKEIEEMKLSDLSVEKTKLMPDYEKMISTTELAEKYGVKAWERHKIVEASELKPIMRNSGRVYFEIEKIVPIFEAWKNGTLKFKPRIRKNF